MAGTATASRGGGKGTGKIRSIRIEFKSNGFEVTVDRVPKRDGKGYPIFESESPKDSMVFTEPGACLGHIESLLGPEEHAAHEKAEGQM